MVKNVRVYVRNVFFFTSPRIFLLKYLYHIVFRVLTAALEFQRFIFRLNRSIHNVYPYYLCKLGL
jgi:hypothetical protein